MAAGIFASFIVRIPPFHVLAPLYALLVCAMLSDRISQAKIDTAEQMRMDFYILLPQLYGESSCTANAHLLSHLTKYVRLWGPLWTHSAFGFESTNGQLSHLFHGNSEIDIVHQLLFMWTFLVH